MIIFFGSNARLIWDKPLSDPIEDIFKLKGGSTDFGPPIEMGLKNIEKYINNK